MAGEKPLAIEDAPIGEQATQVIGAFRRPRACSTEVIAPIHRSRSPARGNLYAAVAECDAYVRTVELLLDVDDAAEQSFACLFGQHEVVSRNSRPRR